MMQDAGTFTVRDVAEAVPSSYTQGLEEAGEKQDGNTPSTELLRGQIGCQ